MCGIIGYVGKDVEENLLDGLKKLEYRGYDSAGLCVLRNGEFYTEKSVGTVNRLIEKTKLCREFGLGIAHTRWATHGKISVENAHPHFSSHGEIAVVHNGIIENFETLKNQLEKKGVYFYGQSDSEVIAKLLKPNVNLKKIKKMLDKIEGTYALAIISKKTQSIYFAKNKSPLYVAIGKDCAMIASDPSCFIGKSDNFYTVDDGEYGCVDLSNVVFMDCNGKRKAKQTQKLNIEYLAGNKNQYQHFMLKEINESKMVVRNIKDKYLNDTAVLQKIKHMDFDRVYLVGCGTAFHAGLIGQRYFRENFDIDVYCDRASEFINENYIIDEKSLCLFISQSGETIDTITALDYAKSKNAHIVSITNVEYSTIATKSDVVLPICAGREIAVASTKAYIGHCLVLFVLTQFLADKDFACSLEHFEKNMDFGDDKKLKNFANKISKENKVVFIGRGYDYITCLEASLKMKEISYINSIAEPSGELKHGPIALIESGTIVVCVATDKKLFSKTINNSYETKSRGGLISIFSSFELSGKTKDNFEFVFSVKDTQKELMPLQSIISLQKLAYFVCVEKGLNPDKPRNLAKSVTVE